MPYGPKINHEALERDGFDSEQPLFQCYVAVAEEKVIGYALYYFVYSTWTGKEMLLEDLCVASNYRNKNVGSMLFQTVAKTAVDQNCHRMDFIVLNWNPAQDFYKKRGAIDITKAEGWHLYRLNETALKELIQ
ncbi:diamine acetyltransferase 2 isoform X2 [Orussus abietinus]|nr:diamine acetyltransferase 2 isoform X2 [Orussus abietinus]